MDLSVIIVNYNTRYFLEQCLHSLNRAMNNIQAEIIIVDNHSLDGSLELIQSRFPHLKFIPNAENLGYARANNQALALAKGKHVLFLNPDTILGEDCIRSSIRFAEVQQGVGAIGLRMIDGQGRFLPESKRGFPRPSAAFNKLFGLAKLFPSSSQFAAYYQPGLNEKDINPIDVVSGAFMMVSRSLMERLGGFDERFFMYGEDIDLSYRISREGLTNYYLGSQTMIHFKGESTLKDSKYVDQFYKAMEQFIEKHFRDQYSSVQFWLIRCGIRFRKLLAHINIKDGLKKTHQRPALNSVLIGDLSSQAKLIPKLSSLGRCRVDKISDADEIIFCEGTEWSYSQIIGYMGDHPGEKDFRIYSEGSESIVGSDSKDLAGISIAW